MKYECCDDCYFYGVEPAICDICDEGDQFEPAEPDEDAFEELLRLSKPPQKKVIPIRPAPDDAEEETEPELEAA